MMGVEVGKGEQKIFVIMTQHMITIGIELASPSSMPLTSSDIRATSISTGKSSPSLLTCIATISGMGNMSITANDKCPAHHTRWENDKCTPPPHESSRPQ